MGSPSCPLHGQGLIGVRAACGATLFADLPKLGAPAADRLIGSPKTAPSKTAAPGSPRPEDRDAIDQLSALPPSINTTLQRWLHHAV
jgi:hypothetical protein